jgi:hypothetical protein
MRLCSPRRRGGSRSRRKAVEGLACLIWGAQWREDSIIGKSNIKNMKAVIFIEHGGTRGRINGFMKVTVTKRERKGKHFPSHSISDLQYTVPRLTDTGMK